MSVFRADAWVRFQRALEAIDACRRLLDPATGAVAGVYLEGAYGSVVHARDEALHAEERGRGLGWSDVLGDGWVQRGEAGASLSDGEDVAPRPSIPMPDLGADVVRSDRLAALATSPRFSSLLADALARHRWLHLDTSASWTASWAAADALVRSINSGCAVARIDGAAMRGTVDRRVAEEFAALGWRRISSPRLSVAA